MKMFIVLALIVSGCKTASYQPMATADKEKPVRKTVMQKMEERLAQKKIDQLVAKEEPVKHD